MAGAKRHEDLVAWQLADQIRVHVFDLTKRDGFAKDLKLRSQTEDAAIRCAETSLKDSVANTSSSQGF
jgi:hypothetical protein